MKKLSFYLTLLALTLLFITSANSQTTIINAPAPSVVDKGSTYLEFDFSSHIASYQNGGFQLYGLRVVHGVHKNLEIGSNFVFTKNGGVSPVEVSPNIKWTAYNDDKHKFTVSGGAIAFIPVKDVSGSRPFAMIYGVAGKTFDAAGGIRLTGGGYAIAAARPGSGTKYGAILGYEHTLGKRVSFVADWFSGNNRFGATAAGFAISATKKDIFFAGYNVGNVGRGNNWFSVYYARYF